MQLNWDRYLLLKQRVDKHNAKQLNNDNGIYNIIEIPEYNSILEYNSNTFYIRNKQIIK
jgi:hypothetical protein